MPQDFDASSMPTAKVEGFASSFLTGKPLSLADITIFETKEKFKTDQNGRFGPFSYPVGKNITLILEKPGFRTTQSATITVPPDGLTGKHNEISFQVPSYIAFSLFSIAMGVKVDENACQVTATVTDYKKTMDDIPQGKAGVKVVLTPDVNIKPFYFGIFNAGPLKHKTNPFQRNLTCTSLDGGIGFLNVPPSDEPYTLTAISEDGTEFSKVRFTAMKGAFINISPPPWAQCIKRRTNRSDGRNRAKI
jgi:hypothetical protein